MGRYWQPCTTSEECKLEDSRLECVKKDTGQAQQWCDCFKGWDLREGWCVNSSLSQIQKSEYVILKAKELSDKKNIELTSDFNILVVFAQISILLLASIIILVVIYFILRKMISCCKNICKSK